MSELAPPAPIVWLLEQDAFGVLALLLLTAPFWASGVLKALDFRGAVSEVVALGLPGPKPTAALVIALQIAGPALIVFDVAAWFGAGALGAFTLLATLRAHRFWRAPSAERAGQFAAFAANIGLIGGLMLAAVLANA